MVKCIIFHKWSKWTEPLLSNVKIHKYNGFEKIEERVTQDRTCLKCGKYEWRMVDLI